MKNPVRDMIGKHCGNRTIVTISRTVGGRHLITFNDGSMLAVRNLEWFRQARLSPQQFAPKEQSQ